MAKKLIPQRHFKRKLDDGIEIVVPSKKDVLSIIVLGFGSIVSIGIVGYLTYMFFASIFVSFRDLIRPSPDHPGMTPVLFLMSLVLGLLAFFMAVGCKQIVYSFLWQIAGKEIVNSSSKEITISRSIFRWKNERVYVANQMKNLHPDYPLEAMFSRLKGLQSDPNMYGVIEFEYGEKTHRFCLEVDLPEAKQIISEIQESLKRRKTG
jgi:hypothetical protein